MNKLGIYGLLIASLGIAWFAFFNHYSDLMVAREVKPTKWGGDDTIFLTVAGIAFAAFSVAFFVS